MTTEDDRDDRDSKDDDAMRALLKRSLSTPDPKGPPPETEFLRGVQRRIRQRSRGKFYADGWSTTSSRVSYALIAAIMLVLVAIAYFALGPMGVSK